MVFNYKFWKKNHFYPEKRNLKSFFKKNFARRKLKRSETQKKAKEPNLESLLIEISEVPRTMPFPLLWCFKALLPHTREDSPLKSTLSLGCGARRVVFTAPWLIRTSAPPFTNVRLGGTGNSFPFSAYLLCWGSWSQVPPYGRAKLLGCWCARPRSLARNI